ncbi:MAG: hypothetical protein AB7T06_41665 [Kofleriaceae bacterium]
MATTSSPSQLSPYALFVPFVVVLIALVATHASVGADVTAAVAFLGIPALIIAMRRHP